MTAATGSPLKSGERSPTDWPAFIVANTELIAPPLVPEIRLHLAAESLPIWRKTEDELGEINVSPPYWAFAWAGGQALARYVLDQPGFCVGKRVLDLGTGSGLTAIAPLLAGAASAIAADIDAIALVAAHLNASANKVELATTAQDLLDQPLDEFDLILVGDLFYERQLADRVLALVDRCAARGQTVLIGDPQRNYFPRGRFKQRAEYRVPVTRELEDAEIKHTAVWQV